MIGKSQTVKSSQTLTSKPSQLANNTSLVIISLYLLVDGISGLNIPDQMGIHWLLLGGMNIFSWGYILKSNNHVHSCKPIFKNGIFILYAAFIIISGLSIFFAINKVESWINYSRLLTTAIAFLAFCYLLYQRSAVIRDISFVIMLIVLAQSFAAVMQFYQGVGKIDLSTLVNSLQSSTGNKNIFAAALVIKIPFIIYSLFSRKGFVMYLSGLALFMAILAVFFINARSAYLGLFVSTLVVIVGIGYLQWKNKLSGFMLKGSLVVIAFVVAFFASQSAIKNAAKFNNQTIYGTLTDRLSTITDTKNETTNIRLKYWQGSKELILERPFTGVGFGNWKLYSPLYANELLDDNIFSKHPHNDFIEIAGESGIPNAIIYLSIFLLGFVFTIRILFTEASVDQKLIAVIALAALAGYFVDAFFNFPSERPNIQILLAFILAIILTNFIAIGKVNEVKTFKISPIAIPLLAVSMAITYVGWISFKSMQAQYTVDADINNFDNKPAITPAFKYEEVDRMFPSFPNIGENSELIGYKKAKYLQKEKRYPEAIKLLDSINHFSPNLSYSDYLKCLIYLDENKLDSAYKYGKIAVQKKPRNFYYYRMTSYLARVNNDVKGIQSLFKTYHSYRNDQQSWSYYGLSMFFSKADRMEVKAAVDSGLKYFPADTILLSYKPFLPK